MPLSPQPDAGMSFIYVGRISFLRYRGRQPLYLKQVAYRLVPRWTSPDYQVNGHRVRAMVILFLRLMNRRELPSIPTQHILRI